MQGASMPTTIFFIDSHVNRVRSVRTFLGVLIYFRRLIGHSMVSRRTGTVAIAKASRGNEYLLLNPTFEDTVSVCLCELYKYIAGQGQISETVSSHPFTLCHRHDYFQLANTYFSHPPKRFLFDKNTLACWRSCANPHNDYSRSSVSTSDWCWFNV